MPEKITSKSEEKRFFSKLRLSGGGIDHLTKYLLWRANRAGAGGHCKGNGGCSIIYSPARLAERAPGMQREPSPGISPEICHRE